MASVWQWNCEKSHLAGQFRVNLAFFRHVQTSTAVQYQIDFATIKQARGRRSVSFAPSADDEVPEKLPKLYPSKSGQKSIWPKSSAKPSTSVGSSENIKGETVEMPLVSGAGTSVGTPSVVSKSSTSGPLQTGTDLSATEDFQFQGPQNIESSNTVSDNTASNLVITNVRSVAEISSSDVTDPSNSGGLSAENLPPLELNKWLHVSIECYPNLLKCFQEGKVKIKKEIEQDVRLTVIKSKKVTAEVFQNFYMDKTSCEWPENLVPPSVGQKGDNDSESGSSSSDEADNTDDDEDYIPEPDDLGGDPDGAQVKKTKVEGTYMSAMYNSYYQVP